MRVVFPALYWAVRVIFAPVGIQIRDCPCHFFFGQFEFIFKARKQKENLS
jgi:hypothetical protein